MQPIRDFSRGAGSELVGSMEHCLCDGRPCDWFTGTYRGLLLHTVKALTQVEMPVGRQGLYGSFLTLDGAERWAAMLAVFVSFTDTTLLSCPTRSSIEAPWFFIPNVSHDIHLPILNFIHQDKCDFHSEFYMKKIFYPIFLEKCRLQL